MSKKAKVSLIILSAVLLSACTVTKTPTGIDTLVGGNQPSVTPTEQSQSTSLRDLLGKGQNQKCTFSTSSTDDKGVKTDTTGTLYFSRKRMAQEVQVKNSANEAINTDMRMMSDGDKIYTWDPTKKTQGMMFKMVEPTGTADGNTQIQSVDLDKKMDMNCSPWTVDESKLTVPTDVKFTDLTELLKNIPTIPAIPGN